AKADFRPRRRPRRGHARRTPRHRAWPARRPADTRQSAGRRGWACAATPPSRAESPHRRGSCHRAAAAARCGSSRPAGRAGSSPLAPSLRDGRPRARRPPPRFAARAPRTDSSRSARAWRARGSGQG
ncbi:MAG: hypothetical protein E6K32_08220, partial [Gammaproteobacteria bacterium]